MTKMAETRSPILPSNSFSEEHLIVDGFSVVKMAESCRDSKFVMGIMASMVQTIFTANSSPREKYFPQNRRIHR